MKHLLRMQGFSSCAPPVQIHAVKIASVQDYDSFYSLYSSKRFKQNMGITREFSDDQK